MWLILMFSLYILVFIFNCTLSLITQIIRGKRWGAFDISEILGIGGLSLIPVLDIVVSFFTILDLLENVTEKNFSGNINEIINKYLKRFE